MPRQGHSQNNQPSAFGLCGAGYFGNAPALGLYLTPNLARSFYVRLAVWLHHKNARKKTLLCLNHRIEKKYPLSPPPTKGVKYWTDVLKLLLYYLTLRSVSLGYLGYTLKKNSLKKNSLFR
jgi:hypothetical protein